MPNIIVVETPRRKPRKVLQRKYPTGSTKNAGNRKISGKKPKEKSISKLIKECDSLFSKQVRGNNAVDGICTCYTCGYKAPLKRVQAGHMISRWYKAVRWHPDNVRVQCWVCNIYKKGDSINFEQRLIKEIGQERVQHLKDECYKDFKLTREYLSALLTNLSEDR